MARYDRVLIDPSSHELDAALQHAVLAANDKRRQRLLTWPLPGRDGLGGELDRPTGYHQWNGGDGPGKPNEGRSVVALAWWTDRAGRKHHRVVGRYGMFSRARLERLLCPSGDVRPPLWAVYPAYVFLKRQGDERYPQAICACGAQGDPTELGWMGPCCDACYDRSLEGVTTPPAWLDPAMTTLRGDEGKFLFLAYSPDGRTLAAGTKRDEVTLYDTASGMERGRLQAKSEWILFAGWTDNNQRIVTGDVTGKLRFYSDRTGLPTGDEAGTAQSECFALSPDGNEVARGDRNHVSLVSHDGHLLRELGGKVTGVQSLAFSPDGRYLAAGCRRGTVVIWDVETGELRGQLERHGSIIAALSFSPHGQTLAVGLLPAPGTSSAEAGRLLLLDVPNGAVKATLAGHEGGTRSVAFAPDGRLLASGGDDGLVRLWEVHSGQERVGLEWHLDSVCSVTFAPDGLTLATGSFDGTVKLWPREVLRPIQKKRDRGAVGATL
jgi:hypothetical protein